jgi:hypothetical protein
MPSTYTPIATQTLGSTVSSVTFSSIPLTYTDLILISSPLTATANLAVQMRLNSDTATNYSRTLIEGNGTSTSSGRSTNEDQVSISFTSTNTTPYPIITQFQNYSNTTTNKTFLSRSSGSTVLAYVGLYRSTSAISTILLFPSSGGSFTAGSTFTLYGIKAA